MSAGVCAERAAGRQVPSRSRSPWPVLENYPCVTDPSPGTAEGYKLKQKFSSDACISRKREWISIKETAQVLTDAVELLRRVGIRIASGSLHELGGNGAGFGGGCRIAGDDPGVHEDSPLVVGGAGRLSASVTVAISLCRGANTAVGPVL